MNKLLKSRKFWIMVVDVMLSTITYFVAHYVSQQAGENIIWLIGSWQPVIYAVINGIATEDAAISTAQGTVDVAKLELKAGKNNG